MTKHIALINEYNQVSSKVKVKSQGVSKLYYNYYLNYKC